MGWGTPLSSTNHHYSKLTQDQTLERNSSTWFAYSVWFCAFIYLYLAKVKFYRKWSFSLKGGLGWGTPLSSTNHHYGKLTQDQTLERNSSTWFAYSVWFCAFIYLYLAKVKFSCSGLDLFAYSSDSKSLHLVESKKLNVSCYAYTHESRLVLMASGLQCKTFHGFQVQVLLP